MGKQVLLRVGSDKAGTVTLGDFAEQNRKVLARAGVFAPQRNCIGLLDHIAKAVGLEQLDMFDARPHFSNNPVERTLFTGFLADRFWEEFPAVFLTTEVLWGRLTRKRIDTEPLRGEADRFLDALRDFFPRHHVTILLHLRRADLYFESLYNQHIKSGAGQQKSEYWEKLLAQDRPTKSLLLLDRLEASFGRQNLIIRPFERDQFVGGDLIDDTLALLPVDKQFNDRFTRSVGNERLHRILLEVLPALNARYGKILSNAALLQISRHLNTIEGLPNQKRLLPREKRHEILEHFAPFYEEVSTRYFAGRPLFLEPVDTLEPGADFAPQTIEALSQILVDLAEHERANRLTEARIAQTLAALSLV